MIEKRKRFFLHRLIEEMRFVIDGKGELFRIILVVLSDPQSASLDFTEGEERIPFSVLNQKGLRSVSQ